jgi:hypothetical protein
MNQLQTQLLENTKDMPKNFLIENEIMLMDVGPHDAVY